nr:MAG TPA: hypothetical protein [Bacteriophage sp.]
MYKDYYSFVPYYFISCTPIFMRKGNYYIYLYSYYLCNKKEATPYKT